MNNKISRVFRMGQSYINERVKAYGLSSGLFFYIIELSEKDGLTLQELSQAVGVDNAHTTRVIKKLIDLDYVYKQPNPLDSRSSLVFLTDKGKEISVIINNILTEWKQIVAKDVSDEEVECITRIFNKFYNNAEEALKIK